ncbi:copper amine oxidase N-terminal domain-containing protein [Peptococcaceae bacterium]|nr:copper amine oxidase N-terminal domain-containing protein [Peptococcaceae bacterium]
MLRYLRLILSAIIFCCLLGFLAYLPSKAMALTMDWTRISVFTIGSTTYVIDGTERTMNVAPYIKNGRTYLPLRYAAYAFGAKDHNIFWDDSTGTVTLIEDDRNVQFIIGEMVMIVNGTRIDIDSAPEVVNGRVMIPLRWITVAFEADGFPMLYWDPITQTITITAVDRVTLPDVQPAEPDIQPTEPDIQPTEPDVQPVKPDIQPIDTWPANVIVRNFSWYYQGRYWSYQIRVPKELYNYYANLERPPTDDYSVYVTHPLDDAIIASIAEHFSNIAWQEWFSPEQTINFVAAFVQSLEYVCDPGLGGPYEYPRYPLETLVDQRGDCEDTSILLASILQAMGFDVVLVFVAPPAHMAVGVNEESLSGFYYEYSGRKYYYLETTDPVWEVGEVPEEYRAPAELEILSLIPRPIIFHDWNAETTFGGWLKLEVTVYNDGTATAQDVEVYAAFDAGQGLVYDYDWSYRLDIEPHSTATYMIYLEIPRNTFTRLIVKIFSEGQLQDESTSDWSFT